MIPSPNPLSESERLELWRLHDHDARAPFANALLLLEAQHFKIMSIDEVFRTLHRIRSITDATMDLLNPRFNERNNDQKRNFLLQSIREYAKYISAYKGGIASVSNVQIDTDVLPPQNMLLNYDVILLYTTNLIKNSARAGASELYFKFTKEEPNKEDRFVLHRPHEHTLQFQIRDNGKGFPTNNELEDYFELGVSSKRKIERKIEGGVGLWAAKLCAKYNNAGLSIRSKPGDTCITMHLPYKI
jgi:signal transduction histidine kinase